MFLATPKSSRSVYMKSRELAFTATAVAALAAGDVNEVRMMEKENFSDDDLAHLTAESPQWACRVSLKIAMRLLNNKFHGLSPSGGHHSLLFDQGFQKMPGWD